MAGTPKPNRPLTPRPSRARDGFCFFPAALLFFLPPENQNLKNTTTVQDDEVHRRIPRNPAEPPVEPHAPSQGDLFLQGVGGVGV